MNKNKKQNLVSQDLNALKGSGIKISRGEMYKQGRRFMDENSSLFNEANTERRVLGMKKFYTRKGWNWPPKKHPIVTTVHLINSYYGKEVCKHTPKDELENKLK
jgi:hypothetical protein